MSFLTGGHKKENSGTQNWAGRAPANACPTGLTTRGTSVNTMVRRSVYHETSATVEHQHNNRTSACLSWNISYIAGIIQPQPESSIICWNHPYCWNQPQPELTNCSWNQPSDVQTHRRSASSPSLGPSSEVPDYELQGEKALKFSGTSAQ